MNEPASDAPVRRSGPSAAVTAGIGAVLLAIAAGVIVQARSLAPGAVAGVGPAAALRVVAMILGVLGIAHVIVAWQLRGLRAAAAPTEAGNQAALAWLAGALVGLMAILELGGGFIAAATWLFVLTARGFGEGFRAKPIAIGLGLSAGVYLFFTQVLSLGLPAGPLERLLG